MKCILIRITHCIEFVILKLHRSEEIFGWDFIISLQAAPAIKFPLMLFLYFAVKKPSGCRMQRRPCVLCRMQRRPCVPGLRWILPPVKGRFWGNLQPNICSDLLWISFLLPLGGECLIILIPSFWNVCCGCTEDRLQFWAYFSVHHFCLQLQVFISFKFVLFHFHI